MANVIEIVVKGRDEGLGSGIDDVDRKARGLKGTLIDVGKTAAGFLTGTVLAGAGAKALQFFGDATKGASDLNEAASKATVVFGDMSDGIFEASETAASSIGIAKGKFLDFAGSFGNMFTQLGIGQGQAAQMSDAMIKLGADFASFHNLDITDVIEAQSAAFRGEYDSAQRFLPLLSAANVEQKAMEQTGKASADSLTAQEKAMATYALMIEGAGEAQGDFARTADGAANSERIAAAEMENMRNEIGQKLLPVSQKVTQIKLAFAKALAEKVVPALGQVGAWINDKVVPAVKDFWAWVQQRLVPVLVNLGAWLSRNVLPVLAAMGAVLVGTIIPAIASFVDWLVRNQEVLAAVAIGIMGALVPAFIAWAVAAGAAAIATIAAAAPFILLAAAIAAFAFLVITHWDTIKAATLAVFNFIKDTIAGVINWVSENWPLLLAILTGPIGLAVLAIVQHWETIKNGFTAVKDWIAARISDIVGFFSGMPGRLAAAAGDLWGWIGRQFKGAINSVIAAWNNFKIPSVTIGGWDPPGPGPTVPAFHTPEINTPNIPYLHGGGIFHAPRGQQEGLAWLRDGEEVSMPGNRPSGRAGPGAAVVLQVAPGAMSGLEELFLSWLQNAIRTRGGGDVQRVLGWSLR